MLIIFISNACVPRTLAKNITCGLDLHVTRIGHKQLLKLTYIDDKTSGISCKACSHETYTALIMVVLETLCLECPRTPVRNAGLSCTTRKVGYVCASINSVWCPPESHVLRFETWSGGKYQKRYITHDWKTNYCNTCSKRTASNTNRTKCVTKKSPDDYYYDGCEGFPCT